MEMTTFRYITRIILQWKIWHEQHWRLNTVKHNLIHRSQAQYINTADIQEIFSVVWQLRRYTSFHNEIQLGKYNQGMQVLWLAFSNCIDDQVTVYSSIFYCNCFGNDYHKTDEVFKYSKCAETAYSRS